MLYIKMHSTRFMASENISHVLTSTSAHENKPKLIN